jgi:hypothetical protein
MDFVITPVAVFVTRTGAFATAAPVLSVTLPAIVPVETCPMAATVEIEIRSRRSRRRLPGFEMESLMLDLSLLRLANMVRDGLPDVVLWR